MARRGGVFLVSLTLLLGYFVGAAAPAQAVASLGSASDGWRPGNGTVFAIERVGDKIILGGSFTTMVNGSGQTATRNRLAAISASTGELLPWAPNPNGEVWALEKSANEAVVYVGGDFTRMGSTTRTDLAAVSAATGAVTSFKMAATNRGGVRALLLRSGSLYVGGTFWKIGTAKRGGGAAVDPSTGALKAWNPDTNHGVYALVAAPDGAMLVGGPFTKAHGVARPYLVKVNSATGALLNWKWSTKCNSGGDQKCNVLSLAADSGWVYVGIDGPGGRVESVNPANGSPRWAVTTDGDVQTVAVLGDTLYIGGHFTSKVGASSRAGLAAIATATGKVQSEPSFRLAGMKEPQRTDHPTEGVWSVLLDQGVLRIGGLFTSVDGASIGRYTSFRLIDRTPPTRPGTPSLVIKLTNSVQLGWAASSDDLGGAVHYRVYRDGQRIGEATSASYQDTGLAAGRTYRYAVAAVDATGNVSARSSERIVTTATGKPVTVTVSRAGYGNVLRIDVNPNRGAAAYRFNVQKLNSQRIWVTQKGTYLTSGNAETRSLTLPRGTYRVYVQGRDGFAPAISKAVGITDPTVKVTAGRNAAKTKLTVNVNPDKGSGYWSFKVQKRSASGKWTTLTTTYRTEGRAETRTLDLKKGTYRVAVSAKYGYKGAVSNPVTLVS